MNKFFVYGTLKIGGGFAKQFDSVRKSSTKAVLKGFDLYGIGASGSAGFPGIVPGDGEVHGEVHEFSKDKLVMVTRNMDYIEGEGNLYFREEHNITYADGTEELVNVYVFGPKMHPDYPKIESGIWEI